MLCFLPPPPQAPPDPQPDRTPPISDAGLVLIVLLVVLCAIVAPFGW